MLAVLRTIIPRGVPLMFFSQNPARPRPSVRFTFFLQAKKVSKKARSLNYVLHPIIWQI
jgi:hypothetical protein